MGRFEKLELTVEAVRELTDDQLSQVAGGAQTTFGCQSYGLYTQTPVCPSGATWFAGCS
jgi:hypothetical protein